MDQDLLTREVIGAAIEVHRSLGPGLLESAYQRCLAYEINLRGLEVITEVPVPVAYKEVHLDHGYRIDLLVNRSLVVETKTVEFLNDVHLAQILTYLRFGGFAKGLLLNFHVKRMTDGIRRVVL